MLIEQVRALYLPILLHLPRCKGENIMTNSPNSKANMFRMAFATFLVILILAALLPRNVIAQSLFWIRCTSSPNDICFTDGNVGIGTTNPLAPLSISDEGHGHGDRISLWDGNNIDLMHGFAIKDSELAFILPGNGGHLFGFYKRISGIDTRVAYIGTRGEAYFSGDVGIGTTNPQARLEIDPQHGNIFKPALIVHSGGDQLKLVDVGDGASITIGRNDNRTDFVDSVFGGALMTLREDGNVGQHWNSQSKFQIRSQ